MFNEVVKVRPWAFYQAIMFHPTTLA